MRRARKLDRNGPDTDLGQLGQVRGHPGLSDGSYTAIEPDQAGKLVEGAEVAVGVLLAEVADRGGPGISLGGR